MTPTPVLRYFFSTREAIEVLLGDAAGDAEAWEIRVDSDRVVVDIVGPAGVPAEKTSGQKPGEGAAQVSPADEQSGETGPGAAEQPKPELKGGPLARSAGICCGEKGFQTFVGAADEEGAAAYVYRLCGVDSRKELDLGGDPARVWKSLEQDYRFWLGGGDVTAP